MPRFVSQSLLIGGFLLLCAQVMGGTGPDSLSTDSVNANKVEFIRAPELVTLERDLERPYFEQLVSVIDGTSFTSIRPFSPLQLQVLDPKLKAGLSKEGVIKHIHARDPFPGYLGDSTKGVGLFPAISAMPGVSQGDPVFASQRDGHLGVMARGYWKDFRAEFHYVNGQMRPPGFQEVIREEKHILPGLSVRRPESNYGYSYFTGRLSYMPSKQIHLEGGRGKHFWGNGYRSLFLSDVARPIDYLKASAKIWKLHYTVMYTGMKDIVGVEFSRSDWRQKYATLHHLSINLGKRMNIGLFEAVIWQGSDTLVSLGIDPNYLNPVIFFRPVEFSTGSAHNSLLGLEMSYKTSARTLLYGQVLIDEFLINDLLDAQGSWRNKHAFQLGMRHFQIGGIQGLNALAEFNYVRPYTYTHGSVIQNYGHFNQPLAHPLGANFWEWVFLVNYTRNKWIGELKTTYSAFGADYAGRNLGGDIYRSYVVREGEFDNYTTQGIEQKVLQAELRVSYLLYSPVNLRAVLQVAQRDFSSRVSDWNATYIDFGFRSALYNTYRDF